MPIAEVDSGITEAVFMWYHSGEMLNESDRFQIIPVDPLTSRLVILSLRYTDTSFTCSASLLQMTPTRISPSYSSPAFTLDGFKSNEIWNI